MGRRLPGSDVHLRFVHIKSLVLRALATFYVVQSCIEDSRVQLQGSVLLSCIRPLRALAFERFVMTDRLVLDHSKNTVTSVVVAIKVHLALKPAYCISLQADSLIFLCDICVKAWQSMLLGYPLCHWTGDSPY